MIDFEEPPFDLHPADRKPADLSEPRYTLAIVLGVVVASALSAWAAYLICS